MSRVTTRLISVMAWLMVRRAVYAGQMDEDKANESYRLDAGNLPGPPAQRPALMPLPDLSLERLALYERIHRLDALAYGTRH